MAMDWLNDVPGLAAFCGTTVLAAALNHGYSAGMTRFARLLGRGDTERQSEVEASWGETVAALNAAADGDERERVCAEHTRRWTAKFAVMLENMEPAERGRVAEEARALAREAGTADGSGRPAVFQTFRGPAYFQNGDHNHQVFHIGTTE